LFKSSPFKRSQRVGDLIKKEVASIFLFDLRDPRLKNLTISRVDLSDDLSNATIFYLTDLSTEESQDIQKGLEKSKGFIKARLGKKFET
jgi:ribosome-binding factor A